MPTCTAPATPARIGLATSTKSPIPGRLRSTVAVPTRSAARISWGIPGTKVWARNSPISSVMYTYSMPWISRNWSISDCNTARSRFRRMSTLASAMVFAMSRLLLTYSSDRWVSTVYTHSTDVERPIKPNREKIPNNVF